MSASSALHAVRAWENPCRTTSVQIPMPTPSESTVGSAFHENMFAISSSTNPSGGSRRLPGDVSDLRRACSTMSSNTGRRGDR